MSSINRVIISGNLTRNPELRNTAGGMAVLGFGVAVNDRVKNPQTGQFEDRPNYVDCTMFGNRANAMSGILAKGTKVAIEGKLRWSQWDKNGEKRSKLEVVVDELVLFSGGQQQPQVAPQAYAPQAPQPMAAPQAYAPQPMFQQTAMPMQQPMPQPAQAYQQPMPQAAPQPYAQPMPPAASGQQQVCDEDIPF